MPTYTDPRGTYAPTLTQRQARQTARTLRRASNYRRAYYAPDGLAVLAFGLSFVVLLAVGLIALACVAGDPTHAPGYAYAIEHGQTGYALFGRASGMHACGPGLTYASGGPMLCNNFTGALVPNPYN